MTGNVQLYLASVKSARWTNPTPDGRALSAGGGIGQVEVGSWGYDTNEVDIVATEVNALEMAEKRFEHHLDRPIQSSSEDALDRKSFVQSIAQRLVHEKASTGLILGIEGPWGSGKSSILNLLEEELTLRRDYGSPLIIRFDPWLISNRDDLIAVFFAQLTKQLRERLGDYDVYNDGIDQFNDKLIKLIAEYGEAVSPAFNLVLPYAGLGAAIFSRHVKSGKERREKIEFLRERVKSGIARFDFPIVILIDELDRLEDTEVRSMAQLLRSVADFPSVSYAIAYDESRVIEALGGASEGKALDRGRAYLEKIVQINVRIPILEPSELSSILIRDVEDILQFSSIKLDDFDRQRLHEIVRLSTPEPIGNTRDIQKVISDFSGRVLLLEGEVNAVDLLGISILNSKGNAQEYFKEMLILGKRNAHIYSDTSEAFEKLNFELDKAVGKKTAFMPRDPEWEARLRSFLFIDDHNHKRVESFKSDRLIFGTALRKSLKQNPSVESPRRSLRKRVAEHTNAGNFDVVERFSSLRQQLRHFPNMDEFDDVYDEVGIRRLASYIGVRIESIVSSERASTLSSRDILRLSSFFHRIVERKIGSDFDLPGVLARLIRDGNIHFAAGVLANDTLVRHLAGSGLGLAKSGIQRETRENLSNLLVSICDKRSITVRRSIVLAARPSRPLGDFEEPNPLLQPVLRNLDVDFVEDLLALLFVPPFTETKNLEFIGHPIDYLLSTPELKRLAKEIREQVESRLGQTSLASLEVLKAYAA